LAGIFKFSLKLTLAMFLARWLEIVPMACIGGILMFVAVNMVKPAEIREVWRENRFEAAMMIYTAVMVVITDFLIGVLSALVVYFIARRVLNRRRPRDAVAADSRSQDHHLRATAAEAQKAASP
jgi:SulP family sulfate permease